MKKILPLILSVALLLSMSATVLAAEATNQEQQVTASYMPGTGNAAVISVDIQWENMSFTYHGASEPVWDADKHEYTGQSTEGGWEASDASISITNHSNVILQTKFEYTAEATFDKISMHFTDDAPYIGSADTNVDGPGTPCSVTVLAIPDGELPSETAANTKIGTIRVKVETVEDAAAVVAAIETRIEKITTSDQSGRGTVSFASPDAETEVGLRFGIAEAMVSDDGITAAEKNETLNQLLEAFYGALKIEE